MTRRGHGAADLPLFRRSIILRAFVWKSSNNAAHAHKRWTGIGRARSQDRQFHISWASRYRARTGGFAYGYAHSLAVGQRPDLHVAAKRVFCPGIQTEPRRAESCAGLYDHPFAPHPRAAKRVASTGEIIQDGVASWKQMSRSSSRHFPVTVTQLPVTRCQVCRRPVAYRPGTISQALTRHYRRVHPGALDPASR